MIGDFRDYPVRHFQKFELGREQNPHTQPRRPARPTPAPHDAASDDVKWLEDAPARSASILESLAKPPPAPGGGGYGDLVTTSAQLRDALNTYASERRVGQLDGRSYVQLDDTITVKQAVNDGTPWGINGGYSHIDWVGDGGKDMLVFEGVRDVSNRCLVVENLSLYGNGYAANPARAGIKLYAPLGDPGCLYKWTLRNLYTSYCEYGFVLEGAVFEGMGDNLHAENHHRDGMMMAHTWTPGEHQGIVSNVMLLHPNMSRNMGAGIRCVNSTNIIFGSFVLNGEGGVVAPEGLRAIAMSNGENTGESLLVVATPGWGSQINGNEASTDGKTHARKYQGDQWVSVGKPMLYLLDDARTGVPQEFNHTSYYGDGTNQDEVQVVKP